MFAKKMLILAVSFGAVTAVAVRPYASDGPWWRLLASVTPLSLIAGAVLALVATD
jgi:hypothetical protein